MAAQLKVVADAFWNKDFWLPPNYTWEDLKSTDENVYYPKPQEVYWSFAVAVCLLVIRYLYERLLIVPLAKAVGIKDARRYVKPIPALEEAYKTHRGKSSHDQIELLAKKTEFSVREVERWFFKRRLKDSPTAMQRFRECSWHFLFYFSAFVYGIYMLWNRNWFLETKYCYSGYPLQHVDNQVRGLYIVELGFYWSLVVTSLTDVKRKDFLEMTIHHCITIALLYLSWVTNFVRIGTLVIVLHDASDFWMAAAKMAKYSKKQTLCEALFTIFIIVWVITRMTLYPFWILWSVIFEIPRLMTPSVSVKVFIVLLCGLQVLHVIWTYLILKIALQKFTHGSLQKDVRSDTESDADFTDDESESESTQKIQNGSTVTKNLRVRNNNVSYRD